VTHAFAQGDLRPLTMAVHKDIVWKTASPRVGLFRFGGVHRRRASVTAALLVQRGDLKI